MSRIRMVVIFVACATIPFLVDAAVDREWPHHSARQWLIYVAGLVAIFVVGGLLELRMERRQRSRDADESPRATA